VGEAPAVVVDLVVLAGAALAAVGPAEAGRTDRLFGASDF